MIEKIKKSILELDQKFKNNLNYLLLLSLFNCAILLNYSVVVWEHIIPILAIFFTILNLWKPKFWWTTIINIGLSFIVLGRFFPRMANHCNIEMIVELIIFGLIFTKIIKSKFSLSRQLIQKVFQISIVTIYFFTGFHKLNYDFFNPCVSCVNGINERLFGNFFATEIKLNQICSHLFQVCTIFIEMIVPFGLLFHKTRKFSAILLLFFHFWLSMVWYADFSGLAVFLVIGSIINFDAKQDFSKIFIALKTYIFFTILAVIVSAFYIKMNYTLNDRCFVQGIIFNIGLGIFALIFFKNYKEKVILFDKKHFKILIFIVFLISFWGMKAYIGLGNSGNLTMFSNLLTEKNRCNHLIINTKKTKVFDFEEDNIYILKLHDSLKKDSLEGFKIPKIEFQFQVHEWAKKYPKTNLNCTYIYKSDTIAIPDLKNSKFNNYKLWYRFVNFRKIQPDGANKCYW